MWGMIKGALWVEDGTKGVGVSVVIGIVVLGVDHLCQSPLRHPLPWCPPGVSGITRQWGGSLSAQHSVSFDLHHSSASQDDSASMLILS